MENNVHKVMTKTMLFVMSLTAGLTMSSMVTAGGRGNPGPLPPMITMTIMDTKQNVIVITGRNFGTTPPSVTLADQTLDVKRFSENEVVASLPHGLASATYGVSVTTSGRNRVSSNLFSATLSGTGKK